MNVILRFLKEVLLKNWGLKLTSILLAFALWLMVRGSQGEHVITVPLSVQIPRNMVIVNERPSFVEITAQGSLPSLTGIQPNLAYNIDLQTAEEGEQMIPLTPEGVRVSPASGLKVIRVNPARVTLVLERVIAKDVRVEVPVKGIPAQGFDLYRLTCLPSVVRVSGPRSILTPLKTVETDPVSITDQDHSFRATVNFNIQDDDIHVSPVGPVEVSVELGPHRLERTFRVPVRVLDEAPYVASPPFISITVFVPVTYRGELAAKDLQAKAAVPDPAATANQITVKPEVELLTDEAAGIVIKRVNPEEILLLRKARKK